MTDSEKPDREDNRQALRPQAVRTSVFCGLSEAPELLVLQGSVGEASCAGRSSSSSSCVLSLSQKTEMDKGSTGHRKRGCCQPRCDPREEGVGTGEEAEPPRAATKSNKKMDLLSLKPAPGDSQTPGWVKRCPAQVTLLSPACGQSRRGHDTVISYAPVPSARLLSQRTKSCFYFSGSHQNSASAPQHQGERANGHTFTKCLLCMWVSTRQKGASGHQSWTSRPLLVIL